VASNLFFEYGWREHSPSDVRQFFGRLGWQNSNTSLGLTASYANNALIGNGLQEQRLLGADYNSVYTIPDKTANLSPAFNFMARHRVGKVQLSGNVYQRYIRTNILNGDSTGLLAIGLSAKRRRAHRLTAAGYTGFDSGRPRRTRRFRSGDASGNRAARRAGRKCNGLLNRSHTGQHNIGFAARTWFETRGDRRSQLTAGAVDTARLVSSNSANSATQRIEA
jgi:hypothetical protein